jgi:alanyl-tRNA synthetase
MPNKILDMTSKEIRQTFLDFFASKGHTIVPSAPMVIKNDPTLMFTNAGMNQFKDIFLGNSTPKTKRATDSQKCLRVSGKHNDLEEVGHDSYHHTMFEMLGNWSFGDYFKVEAIDWAWELLTDVFKIDKERLYATVFEGDAKDGTSMDEEAKKTWLKHLPEDRILLGNHHDNFWEMGDTGPCGPCSEIHVDLRSDEERAKLPGRELVNKSNPLVIEIWNLVFMQFNRKANGSLEPLPNKNIDTGMGFERLCMVLQGKQSNYDTDVFTGIIGKIEELSGHKYHENDKVDVAMRVIADHIRAISFSIADGQLPSNVKAGYVIRRILRRAVRYGYTFLGFNEPFLCRLVDQVAEDMGDAYPEIKKQQKLIESVIKEEEVAFLRTLDRGIKMIDDYMKGNAGSKVIAGKDAFVLYDTYGFPIDLTELIATENGYSVDLEEFNSELQKQKERARNATSNEFGDWTEYGQGEQEQFLGYDYTELEGVNLLKQRTVKSKNKVMYQLVFDRTPFYAEMGGEVGDTGYILSENGEKISILNTIKENNLTIHIAEKIPSNCTQAFTLHVDENRRLKITNNHSATHLLDHALREIVGTHVEQKGSYVGPDYFRFDFSHFAKLTDEELRKVENSVNQQIRANYPLEENRSATMDEAKAMGAIALFGEKYGDRVRVVKFGNSIELCGGCHVKATGQIGLFKILSESAIAAGVRRIEAVTGETAESYVQGLEDSLRLAKSLFNNVPDLEAAIRKTLDENTEYKKELEEVAQQKTADLAEKLVKNAKEINGVNVIKLEVSLDPTMVRNAGFILQKKLQNCVLAGAYQFEGKPCLILAYSDDLVAAGHNASKDIREAAKFIMGGGGGQPAIATAGGKNVEGLQAAMEKLIELATTK